MKIITPLILFFFMGHCGFAQTVDSLQPTPFSSPSWIGFRSAIIPGWGQWVNHKPLKAAVVLTSTISIGAGIYVQDTRRKDAIEKKNLSLSLTERNDYTRLEKFYENDRNKMIWWLVGLTLFSTFDAYVDAHLANFDVEPVVKPKQEIGVKFILPIGLK